MIDYAARRFREEVSEWPDGSYEADAYVDHDPLGNPDVHLHVKVTVAGDSLTIDFTGSDSRPEIQAWSTYGTHAGTRSVRSPAMMDPEIPKNEGFFEQINLVVPKGCVLNPDAGRPVSAGTHHPGADVGEVIAVAMQHVLPERAVPQTYKTGIPTIITGKDPRTGAAFTDHSAEVYAGWCNASKGMDAWGALNASFGNLWKATAEINEALYPHVQWSRDYRTDSGGPGQWRGICGSHYEKEVCVDAKVYTYVVGMKYPMPGICGGENGAPNEMIIRYGSDDPFRVQHTADWVPISAGQRVMYDYGGGGGWGDPLDRDPQAVLDDVLDEYVSVEGALATTASCSPAHSKSSASRSTNPRRSRLRDERRAERRRRLTDGLSGWRRRRGDLHRPHLCDAVGRGRPRQDPDDARRPVTRRDERSRATRRTFRLERRRLLPRARHPRARHHHRRQHDDRDERCRHRTARHRRAPRRDRAPALSQGRDLGPELPRARHRSPAGAPASRSRSA